MNAQAVLEQALRLPPGEKFLIVDTLLQSLDEPDQRLDEIWIGEAERRLAAYRKGEEQGIPLEEIFRDEK